MVSIPKLVGVLSCGLLLCLGLSTVASSADQLNTDHSGRKMWTVDDKDRFVSGKEVKDEIVKIDGDHNAIRDASGAEGESQTDNLNVNEAASVCFKEPGYVRYTIRMDSALPNGQINTSGVIKAATIRQ